MPNTTYLVIFKQKKKRVYHIRIQTWFIKRQLTIFFLSSPILESLVSISYEWALSANYLDIEANDIL